LPSSLNAGMTTEMRMEANSYGARQMGADGHQ